MHSVPHNVKVSPPWKTHQATPFYEGRAAVSAPVYGNRGDAQELRCGQHTAGNLAAVCNKQLAKGIGQLSSCRTLSSDLGLGIAVCAI